MKVVYNDQEGRKRSLFAPNLIQAASIMNQLEIAGIFNSWVE